MSFLNAIDRGRELRITWAISGLIAVVCAGLSGCANSDSLPVLEVYDVKGNVLLPDGQPLNGGRIYFVSKAGDLPVTPSGAIGPDGTFSLVTGGSGDGAPAGEYKVRIEPPSDQTSSTAGKPLFPIRYYDEDSSGVVVTVRAEANQLDPIRLQ